MMPDQPDSGVPSRAAYMEPEDIVDEQPVRVEDAPLRALCRVLLSFTEHPDLGQLRRRGLSLAEFETRFRDALTDLLDAVGVSTIYLEGGEDGGN